MAGVLFVVLACVPRNLRVVQMCPRSSSSNEDVMNHIWYAEAASSTAPFHRQQQQLLDQRIHMLERKQALLDVLGIDEEERNGLTAPKEVNSC
jgi:hypothetical protein